MWAPGKAVEDLGWRVGTASVGRGLGCLWPGNLSSWVARGGEVARAVFMFAQARRHGPGLSRSWGWHRDRERPAHGPAGVGKAPMAPGCVTMQAEERAPAGLAYNWMGQRKSAAGLRVTVTSPRLCAVSTAWAEVRRNGVVPGVKITLFTAHRPPR